MHRQLATAAIALAAVTLAWGGLEGARTTVTLADNAPATRNVTGLTYGSFLEASAFWDLDAAGHLAQRVDERKYIEALQTLIDGDESTAEGLLRAVLTESRDESMLGLATSVLQQLTFADDRWDAFGSLRDRSGSDNPFSVLVESLADGTVQTLTIPDEPSVIVTTPDAGLPTLRVSVNGKPFDFILDTGAPFSVINTDVAAAAGIQPVGERTGVIRNAVHGRPARIERLELGQVIIENHPVMIIPTEGMTIPERPSENKTIQGILGWPLIRRLDIEIDLAGGRTTIRKPRRDPAGARNLFFCFRPIVIARDAKGMPLHFLLDTGTDGTTLFQRIGKKTKLGKVKQIKLGSSRIGETTHEVDGRMLTRFEIFLGNHRVRFEKIPLFPGSALDGILGTDVHRAGRVRIDYMNGRYALLD